MQKTVLERGIDLYIDPYSRSAPKNLKDAMPHKDRQDSAGVGRSPQQGLSGIQGPKCTRHQQATQRSKDPGDTDAVGVQRRTTAGTYADTTHWSARHHVMECLKGFPIILKLTYWRSVGVI
jgi:hypothetical protein